MFSCQSDTSALFQMVSSRISCQMANKTEETIHSHLHFEAFSKGCRGSPRGTLVDRSFLRDREGDVFHNVLSQRVESVESLLIRLLSPAKSL